MIKIKHMILFICVTAIVMTPVAHWARRRATYRERAARYGALADHHGSRVVGYRIDGSRYRVRFFAPNGRPVSDREGHMELWHRMMKAKYNRASLHPWEDVPTDSPEPEWRLFDDVPPVDP